VLISDNLSSHLSVEIISQCQANDIRFVFLPPNSTHITQPLDVAFFRPVKMAWRKILCEWKSRPGNAGSTLAKDEFPALLKQVEAAVGFLNSKNLREGFRACGIYPLDQNVVLAKLPSGRSQGITNQVLNDAVIDMLKEQNQGGGDRKKRQKRTRVSVMAGKSVCTDDFTDQVTASGAMTSVCNDGASTSTVKGGARKSKGKSCYSESNSSSGAESDEDEDDSEISDSSTGSSTTYFALASDVEPDSEQDSEPDIKPDKSNKCNLAESPALLPGV